MRALRNRKENGLAAAAVPRNSARSSVRLCCANTQQVGARVTASSPISQQRLCLHINEGEGPRAAADGCGHATPSRAGGKSEMKNAGACAAVGGFSNLSFISRPARALRRGVAQAVCCAWARPCPVRARRCGGRKGRVPSCPVTCARLRFAASKGVVSLVLSKRGMPWDGCLQLYLSVRVYSKIYFSELI